MRVCGCECAKTPIHSVRCRSIAEWLRSGRLGASVSGLVAALPFPTHFVFIFAPAVPAWWCEDSGLRSRFWRGAGQRLPLRGSEPRRVDFTAVPVPRTDWLCSQRH